MRIKFSDPETREIGFSSLLIGQAFLTTFYNGPPRVYMRATERTSLCFEASGIRYVSNSNCEHLCGRLVKISELHVEPVNPSSCTEGGGR